MFALRTKEPAPRRAGNERLVICITDTLSEKEHTRSAPISSFLGRVPHGGATANTGARVQVSALALLLLRHSLSSEAILNLTMSLPALAVGAGIGVLMFRRVNEAVFRSAVLVVLAFAGVTLVI